MQDTYWEPLPFQCSRVRTKSPDISNSLMSKTEVNPHPFTHILSPQSSCSPNIHLFIFVHTAPLHFENRWFIRNTWGNPAQYKQIRMELIFVMGATNDNKVQSLIEHEESQYRDILQEDFIDSYKNMTYKYMAGLKYVNENCKKVPLILKTDDDILINMFSVFKLIARLPNYPCHGLLMCHTVSKPHVFRDSGSKWSVPHSDWPEKYYPDYCMGLFVLMSKDIIEPLYQRALHTPYFWIDDVFITGIIRKLINVTPQCMQEDLYDIDFYQAVYKNGYNQELRYVFSHSKDFEKMTAQWNKLVSHYQNEA